MALIIRLQTALLMESRPVARF